MNQEESALQEAAKSAEQLGNLEGALIIWRRLSSSDENRPDYHCKVGRLAEKLGRWEEAERAFLEAERSGNFPFALTLLGSLFLRRTDGDPLANARKAEAWLHKAVELRPDQVSLSFLGSAYTRLGDRETAKKTFRKIIELDDKYAEAYFNLGVLSAEAGQNEEAEGLLRRAIALNPNFEEAHKRLRILLQELGRNGEWHTP